jgi:hypothetical protein
MYRPVDVDCADFSLFLVEAPELIDLWQHNFKSLVDARSGFDNLDKEFLSPGLSFDIIHALSHLICCLSLLEPPPKRRKTKTGYEPDFSSADRGRGARKPLDDGVGIGGWEDGGGNWGVDCECRSGRDIIPWKLMLINARWYGRCPSYI